jgi:thiol:disulfide interchange protein DsbD
LSPRLSAAALTAAALLGVGAAWARDTSHGGRIQWFDEEAKALAESRRTGKPVLLVASAEWCAACRLLERKTWSDARVVAAVRARFIPLRADLTAEGAETDALMKGYGVQELPTVLVCLAQDCATGKARRAEGYLPPAEMLSFLAPQK